MKTWLLCGFSAAIVFQLWTIISSGKIKEENVTWANHLYYYVMMVVGGIFSLLFVGFATILSIASTYEQTQKPLVFVVLIMLTGGALSECTSKRIGANCKDGSYSHATGRGACSSHGGVRSWDKIYWWEDER